MLIILFMVIFVYILVSVYYLSINVYSFTLLKSQKNLEEGGNCSKIRDGHLLIIALLGGALGIFVGAFILKFRTKSLFLMVFMPVITAINAYLLVSGFLNGFWFLNRDTTAFLRIIDL